MPKNYPLHPACKLFPPLGREELEELADDIKRNGLQNDIILFPCRPDLLPFGRCQQPTGGCGL